MRTVGAVASIVQLYVAGEASTLLAASFARTLTVWAPSARLLNAYGLATTTYAALSRLASKVEFASVDDSVKEAVRCVEVAAGPPDNEVSGGVVSVGGGGGGGGPGGELPPPPPPQALSNKAPPSASSSS